MRTTKKEDESGSESSRLKIMTLVPGPVCWPASLAGSRRQVAVDVLMNESRYTPAHLRLEA